MFHRIHGPGIIHIYVTFQDSLVALMAVVPASGYAQTPSGGDKMKDDSMKMDKMDTKHDKSRPPVAHSDSRWRAPHSSHDGLGQR